jgi:site-specific DNA recombinase
MQAGILVRLSEEKDSELGTAEAFERFEGMCRRLIDQRDWVYVKTFSDDIVSAYQKGKRRPGFEAALRALEHGTIQVLVVPTVDRLVRRWWDKAKIKRVLDESGRSIVVAATGREVSRNDPESGFIFDIEAALAERESAIIGERVRRQIVQAASKGRAHHGGIRPFGYTKRGGEIKEDEAKITREAARRAIAGYSLRSIVTWVNEQGVLTPTGRAWRPKPFSTMLHSPHIAGLLNLDEELIQGVWPAILDRATWEELQIVLKPRGNGGRPLSRILSGVLVCGRCDEKLYARKRQSGIPDYACRADNGRNGCGRNAVAAEPLEAFIIEKMLDRWVVLDEHVESGDRSDVKQLIQDLEAQLRDLGTEWGAGRISKLALIAADNEIRKRLDRAYEDYEHAIKERYHEDLQPAENHAEAEATWNAMDLVQKREHMRAIFGKLVILPAGGPRRYFDGDARVRTAKGLPL